MPKEGDVSFAAAIGCKSDAFSSGPERLETGR